MEKGIIKVYCGDGQGKSSMALGRAIAEASEGKEVFMIQFLKGKQTGSLEYLNRLEPEFKVFRFEKEERYFEDLSLDEQKEESINICNGLNFARKVLSIGECDLLILDEVLGLIDLGIVTVDDIIKILDVRDDEVDLIMTGRSLPEELASRVDLVVKVESFKSYSSQCDVNHDL